MRPRTPHRYTPRLERIEERLLLSASPLKASMPAACGCMSPVAPTATATATVAHTTVATPKKGVHVAVESKKGDHEPDHDGDDKPRGNGNGHGPNFFNCLAQGIYNFGIVTITNNTTTNLSFSILAKPCPGTFVNVTLASGQSAAYYTHFPATGFTPSFQVNLGGLNLFNATPNIISGKRFPQFVYQITTAMGSQYEIVQPKPNVFVLKPG